MIKFNNGRGAVVCDVCGKIISEGVSGNVVDICPQCATKPSVVDNFDLVESLLDYKDYRDFYWVQVIKRRKDNPGMHGDYIQYGSYCFYSYEDLLRKKDELIKLSKTFNARVVLWVNPRNMKELMLPLAQISLEYMQSNQPAALPSIFEHTCGKNKKKGIKSSYLVDVDTKDVAELNTVVTMVKEAGKKNPDFEIRKIIPTLHGYHIIATGFDLHLFDQLRIINKLGKIDIHKDNPTVLYFCPI